MNILYLSCHSILEYDELRIFEELGYDYFSLGAYINPRQPHDDKRPPLNGQYHEHLASIAMVHSQNNLHEKQIEWADVIIIMHIPDWIEKNWGAMKHKRVIWRSIGQSVAGIEERLKPYVAEGLEIVRYSPAEANIPGYAGESAMIRFYKDPDEFKGWTGGSGEVVTFAQSMRSRGEFCNFDVFSEAVKGLKAHVNGPNNEDAGDLDGGLLSYPELKAKMRTAGAYFYTGTHPASYTLNFMEAWMTGAPIVAIGSLYGNSKIFGQQTYEIPNLIEQGITGFVTDDVHEMNDLLKMLLANPSHAAAIGKAGRARAIQLFGKDTIKQAWKGYLER